ncbi:MAG: integrase arm-type DNA-binding domain-containing protein [Pseudomonadales bacterium]
MPKRAKELSAMAVRKLDRPGVHPVGGVAGLYIQVSDTGAKSWLLRVMVGSKRRTIGLGPHPAVSLKEAREKAARYREQIQQGIDPVAERKAAKANLIVQQAKRLTFREAAQRCHNAKAAEFRNEKHRKDWLGSLERHAFPVIGDMPVDEIELPHILSVLEPVWYTHTETASRVRQRLEACLTWATVSGHRSGDNPARWQGNLKEVLPNPSKVKTVKHHAALPFAELPVFMAQLRQREGMAARALEFVISTAARSGEVRKATWAEIDFDAKTWTIPGERIKAGKRHTVPLSSDALKILKALPRYEGSDLIFPAQRGGPLSDMALTMVLRRMDIDATVHGFRSTFKDWCRSRTNYPDEVSELALAHVSSDATRAAYARDELLPKRAELMKDWARFCRGAESGDILPLHTAKAR